MVKNATGQVKKNKLKPNRSQRSFHKDPQKDMNYKRKKVTLLQKPEAPVNLVLNKENTIPEINRQVTNYSKQSSSIDMSKRSIINDPNKERTKPSSAGDFYLKDEK